MDEDIDRIRMNEKMTDFDICMNKIEYEMLFLPYKCIYNMLPNVNKDVEPQIILTKLIEKKLINTDKLSKIMMLLSENGVNMFHNQTMLFISVYNYNYGLYDFPDPYVDYLKSKKDIFLRERQLIKPVSDEMQNEFYILISKLKFDDILLEELAHLVNLKTNAHNFDNVDYIINKLFNYDLFTPRRLDIIYELNKETSNNNNEDKNSVYDINKMKNRKYIEKYALKYCKDDKKIMSMIKKKRNVSFASEIKYDVTQVDPGIYNNSEYQKEKTNAYEDLFMKLLGSPKIVFTICGKQIGLNENDMKKIDSFEILCQFQDRGKMSRNDVFLIYNILRLFSPDNMDLDPINSVARYIIKYNNPPQLPNADNIHIINEIKEYLSQSL